MTRSQRISAVISILTAVYLLACLSVLPIPLLSDETKHEILPMVPWWLLVAFGSYSLGSLGWGLFTFRDCPEAHQELLLEITAAKNDLRMHGVSVD